MEPDVQPGDGGDASAEQARIDALVDETLGLPKQEVVADEQPNEEETPTGDDAPADGEPADEPGDAGDEPDAEDEEDAPAPEVVPSDDELFIEVEDVEGNKYKISKIEDLPEDFVPKNNREALRIIKETDRLEREIADRDALRAENEQKAIIQERSAEIEKAWTSDIQRLIDNGDIPKPKVAESDPKYADDPSVKATHEVFEYITKTNAERKKAGDPNMLTSFSDAFRLLKLEKLEQAEANAKKEQTNTAKAKAGVMNGNSTPSSGDSAPYVAGSAKSIWDIQ